MLHLLRFSVSNRVVALGRLINDILRFLPGVNYVWFQLITLVFSKEENRCDSGLGGS